MDFKENQLALEAHIRMRCNWRDDDEITEEEWLEYAIEYITENPIPDLIVTTFREALVYDQFTGETTFWNRIPKTSLYWEPGAFWWGMKWSLIHEFDYLRNRPSRLRGLAVYFGLIEDPEASSADE